MRGVSIAGALASSSFDSNETKLLPRQAQADPVDRYRQADLHNCYGLAWSARRATLEASGFYDRNIIGGGDRIKVFAALDRLEDHWRSRPVTTAHKKDAIGWMTDARSSGLFAGIGALDHKLYHLWHGSLGDRDYIGRYDVLVRHGFDPRRDIRMAANGTWEWTDPSSALASEVGAYFFSRREDGAS